jgi:FkbM family methyltransferase
VRGPNPADTIKVLLQCRPQALRTSVDVGAQLQTGFLREGLPDAHHILVEPAREYHERLKRFYQNRSFTLVPAAVADAPGRVGLVSYSNSRDGQLTHTRIVPGAGAAKLDAMVAGSGAETLGWEFIDAVTLDQLIAEHQLKPLEYLIKIDVDGQDARILAASETAAPNASCLVVEAVTGLRGQKDRTVASMIALAASKGFHLIDIVSPCYYSGKLAQVDLVFLNERLMDAYRESGAFDPACWQPSGALINALNAAGAED